MKFYPKSNLKVLAVLIVSLLFASCFQVKEIVHFNKDGSGTFEFRTDLSEMMALMDMMKGLGDVEPETDEEGDDVYEDEDEDATEGDDEADDYGLEEEAPIEEESPIAAYSAVYKDQIDKISQIAGISEAQVIEDEISYVVGIYFKFKNAKALNAALNELFADENKPNNREFFKISKKKVQRVDVVNMKDEVLKAMGDDGEEMDESTREMMKSMFAEVTYTTEYTFEQKVKKTSNSAATVEGNSVVLVQKMFDETSKTKLDDVIKLK